MPLGRAGGWKADSSIQEKHVASSSSPSGFAGATLQPPKKDEEVKENAATTTTDLGGAGGPLQATQQSEKKADIPTEEKICASTGTEHGVDPKSSEDTGCENSKPLRIRHNLCTFPFWLATFPFWIFQFFVFRY